MASEIAKDKVAIGLDFGTQNSVCSSIPIGSAIPVPIKSKAGDTQHISAIYYHENSKDGGFMTGKNALDMLPSKNVILNPKRTLGVSNKRVEKLKKAGSFNADLVDGDEKDPVKFKVTIDGIIVEKTAIEVVTDILSDLRKLVHSLYGDNVGYVVSAPEKWNMAQSKALQTALAAAGITPLATLSEPAAALMCHKSMSRGDETQHLAADLGCGTFDCCLMEELEPGKYKTIAAGGDPFLGSREVDINLYKDLETEMKKDPTFDPNKFKGQEIQLLQRMRDVKHKISELPRVTEIIHGVCAGPFSYVIDQEKKKKILSKPVYDKVIKALNDVVKETVKKLGTGATAKQVKDSVQQVILVGGGMRDPYFGDVLLPNMFTKAKIIGKYGEPGYQNLEEVVSYGCAFWAASKMKTKLPLSLGLPPSALHMRVLSQDFGIETVSRSDKTGEEMSWFYVVVPAQSGIPLIQPKLGFTTSIDNQADVKITVFQGKGELTTDDGVDEIGAFVVPIHPVNRVGEPKIDVEFEISKDSVLTVRAGERGQEKKEVVVGGIQ